MRAAPAPLVFDRRQILSLSDGDKAFTRTLLTRLMQTNRSDIRALLASHAAGSAPAVAARAHRIRGGCSIVGAGRVAAQALVLESHLEAHGLDARSGRAAWRLARRILELERALLAWLASLR